MKRQSRDTTVDVPVLIAGAGPTGLVASILLSRFGVPSLTVERHPGTTIYPRGIAVNTRSMEILRGLGLEQRVRAAGFDAEPRVARSRTLVDADVVLSPSLGTPATDASPSDFTLCSQYALEPILRDEASSQPGARVWFTTELVAFEQRSDGIRATVVDRATGQRTEVRSRYLIAADGANSFIRGQLGLEVVGTGVIGHNVAIHFEAPLMQHLPHRPNFLHFVANDRAQGLMFTTDGVSRWVFNHEYSPDNGETPAALTPARAIQLIRDGSGVSGLDVAIRAMLPWETRGDMAAQSRVGNVFLAGDAAHRMTPAGGLGMNTGIQDAHNLAWKLAAALQRWGDDSLLETYATERRPVAQANVQRSVDLARGAFSNTGAPAVPPPRARTAIDFDLGFGYASTAIMSEELSDDRPDGDYHPDARPGYRVPHCWLGEGDAVVSTHDVLGPHFTVFHGGASSAWERAGSEVAAESGVGVAVRSLANAIRSDALGLFGISPSGAVLVRPDGHVAWRQPAAPANATAELRHALYVAVGARERAAATSLTSTRAA